MNKTLKISLIVTLIASLIGVFLKLKGIKTTGDAFLAIGVVSWFIFVIDFVFRFINQKTLSHNK